MYNFLGIEYENWLLNAKTILRVIFGSEMWRAVGWDSIIYLTAILAIAPDLYEAAIIDGANRWNIVRFIIGSIYVETRFRENLFCQI